MIQRTTWEFDLRVTDEMDAAEYSALARTLQRILEHQASVSGSLDGPTYTLKIEEVDAP